MNQRIKVIAGSSSIFSLMTMAQVLGQTNDAPAMVPDTDVQAGIASAMLHQIASNPSSSLVIAALCVFAWLVDDLPFVNSRYVAHLTVVMGACIFRFFSLESAVPKYFPHPQAVFVVNGILAGFIAFVIHKQVVSRIINFFRVQSGAVDASQPRTQLKEQTNNQNP